MMYVTPARDKAVFYWWKIANFSGNLEEMKIPLEKGEEFEPEVYYFF